MVESGATRHICAERNSFSLYTIVGYGGEIVYMADSGTTLVLGKGKVLLNLTLGKTLPCMMCCMFQIFELICFPLLGKVGVLMLFESSKNVMTNNKVCEKEIL